MLLSNRVATAVLLPILVAQGRRVRRTVPRLPEASGTSGSVGEGTPRRRVVVVGDSVAAGVGVARGEDTVAGRLALLLSAQGRVDWALHAAGGLDAVGVQHRLEPLTAALSDADLVVLSVGVNDLKRMHPVRRWRTDLEGLLRQLRACAPGAGVVMLGLPPLETFPALPRPLRDVLAARGRRFDAVARELSKTLGVRYVNIDPSALDGVDAFAADGFHPSAHTHGAMAEAVVRAVRDEGSEADVVR